MPTVLFAWELGANLGHLVPLSAIASNLSQDGHRAVFAVLDLAIAGKALAPDAVVLQAPVWPAHRHFGARGTFATYADVLAAIGFGDSAKLGAMLGAWSRLVDLVKPDAVVADHSPGLQVALHERGIPVVAVGSAFAVPPLGYDSFPPLRGDRAPAVPESRLLESLRRAQESHGRRPSARLAEPFRSAARVVFGIPELDPYRSFRQEPLSAPPGGLPAAQPWQSARRLFAYLGGETPNFEALAQALSTVDATVEAYFRGEAGPVPEFLRLRGVTVHETAPPLGEVLARCSHILTHGGAMTAAAALTAGRPQLVLAPHDEAELNLALLEQNGVGIRLDVKAADDARAIAGAIDAFLGDHEIAERAQELARRIAARRLPDGAVVAAAAVRQALA